MKICFVTSECVPYVKTGGLADVSGSLPKALSQSGCDVRVFLPLYKTIDKKKFGLTLAEELQNIPVQVGNLWVAFNVWYGELPNSKVKVYFIECPEYFHRATIYTDEPDEDERFILFQLAVIQILQRNNWSPDVVHCNDWQSSLLPVCLKKNHQRDPLFANTATLLTIHNIAFQGRFHRDSVIKAGLSYDNFYPGGPYEFHDQFCFLKAGIIFSDIISTVSETHARDIQTDAYGAGLEGVVTKRREHLFGIPNGIDTKTWHPGIDDYLSYHYSVKNLSNKIKNKEELLKYAKLPFSETMPVVGMVSRLTSQKGFDLVRLVIKKIMQLPLQFVVLGIGEKKYENFLRRIAKSYPDKFFTFIGYNNELAHQITGGCDMFLMPSHFEPCGLNQMYSLNYGTVPIVRKTGGLADTVKDYHEYYKEGNGFTFSDFTSNALYLTIQRALDMFKDKEVWKGIMQRGMKDDFSWKSSAKRYIELYKKAKIQQAELKNI